MRRVHMYTAKSGRPWEACSNVHHRLLEHETLTPPRLIPPFDYVQYNISPLSLHRPTWPTKEICSRCRILQDSRHQAGGVFAECQDELTFCLCLGVALRLHSATPIRPSTPPSATDASMYHLHLLSTATPLAAITVAVYNIVQQPPSKPGPPLWSGLSLSVLDLSCPLGRPAFSHAWPSAFI